MTSAFESGLTALRAGRLPEARRWLEAARRQEPWNAAVALALGNVLIRLKDPSAVSLHTEILAGAPLNEGLCGLAASLRMVGRHIEAAEARGKALSLFSATRSANQEADLAQYCRAVQIGGWCGLSPDGRLTVVSVDPQLRGTVDVTLDGISILKKSLRIDKSGRLELRLPDGWATRRILGVHVSERPLLGHPISLTDIARVEGLLDSRDGDLHGWAWCPHDPEYDPVLTLRSDGQVCGTVVAQSPASEVPHWRPLARPRGFRLSAETLPNVDGAIEVWARDGRMLYGSPMDPAAWRQSAAFAAQAGLCAGGLGRLPLPRTPMLPMPAALTGAAPAIGQRPEGCVIVVPIHDATDVTLRCLASALASLPHWADIVAIDDASRDPVLLAALASLEQQKRITVLHHEVNAGFSAAVNTGLAFAGGRDVVLLNSDTLVPPSWLERLRDAAYSGDDIGTVTPLSNDAPLVRYPDHGSVNPCPDLAETCRLDRLAAEANPGATVDLPTAVGFCMFIKRDCLRDTGGLRADVFAQGYGEENDFCMRARHLGWRHVAAPGIFVAHVGGESFRGARAHLRSRNLRILNELHPGYDALIERFMRADPLSAARRALDRLRWCASRDGRPAVLLITHGREGGIRHHVQERAKALRRDGLRPLCLWPVAGRESGRDCVLGDGPEGGTPHLRYAVETELEAVAALLRHDNVVRIEVHSLIGHDHNVIGLADLLGVPYDMVLHDYASLCPRITLVTGGNRFCGEPDLPSCEECILDHGGKIDENVSVAYLRARSSAQLGGAASVIVPSHDAASRLKRYFPGVLPRVEPWQDDSKITPIPRAQHNHRRICVIGAIGQEKGFDVLLACARDARRRGLDITYIVIGYTSDDGRLLQLGNVEITGKYNEEEVGDLIRRQKGNCAFIPSIWPETWCYALSRAWEAGLHAFAFDIGAPAERIRQNGWGILLRLGMEPGKINDAFTAS